MRGDVVTGRDVPVWAADYIGIPFVDKGMDRAGANCWGLVRMVLDEQFGVLGLPTYTEDFETTRDRARLAEIYGAESQKDWVRIGDRDDLSAVRAGDVLLLRPYGLPTHVGVVVARGWMLHVEEGIEAALVRYDGPVWKNRIVMVGRHRELAGRAGA